MTEHPSQNLVVTDDGVVRFQRNAIVRYLLDAGPFDMNHLALLPNIPNADARQFAQLIGYSVSGYGDLSYVPPAEAAIEDARADAMLPQPNALSGSQQFYVQDSRSYVGNSMLWWAKDGKGYVCDIREAHVFTEDELPADRATYVPWPKAYIDARVSHHIDMQHCRREQMPESK